MKFNINNHVKVKLNEIGIGILEKQNAELRSRLPSFPEFTPPETDQNGFSRWQLWELMGRFGPHISLGVPVPFDTVILIDDVDEITTLRKQAEAVSDFGQPFDRMHRMVASRAVHEDAEDYAQRLRQQANELENSKCLD